MVVVLRVVVEEAVVQSESVNPDIVYPTNPPSNTLLIACDGFSSIINGSLIRQIRVQCSDSDTSFHQQTVTFQYKITSIIQQHENVAKYFRWVRHA